MELPELQELLATAVDSVPDRHESRLPDVMHTGRRRRRTRRAATTLAVAVLGLGAAFGTVAITRDSAPKGRVETQSPTTVASTQTDCTLPSISPGGRSSDFTLGGPAVAALKGGPALAPLDLDGGKFTLTPPPAGTVPAVSATDAECAALASINANGMGLLELPGRYGGAAVGYGLVSVDPKLVASALPTLVGQTNQNTQPKMPAASQYQQRLAWVVVVKNVLIFHCPINGCHFTGPPSDGYDVFVIDAQTGTDALLYTEAQPGVTASVSVPVEQVSVPWTLVSRSPDGYHGVVRATVLPCDGVPNPVPILQGATTVSVVVERPVNPSCGAPHEVNLPIQAATVTSDLPTELIPGPLGPMVTPAAPGSCLGKCPGETGGVLRQLRDADNGTTIHVHVHDVLAITPLGSIPPATGGDFASTDPSVLGPLSLPKDEVGEFRAWKTGTADLSSARGKWIVHVVVDP